MIFERCENRGKRGGTANDVKRGSLRRGSLIEEGISLCAKQAGRIGVGGDGNRKSEDRAPLTYIFVLAPSVFYPTPRVDTSETNDPDGGKKGENKKERKEGRREETRGKLIASRRTVIVRLWTNDYRPRHDDQAEKEYLPMGDVIGKLSNINRSRLEKA